jgi:phosphoglycolate phosphatase-like HAD superfamily hydrolase
MQKTSEQMVEHAVIFDVDGTLIDSNDAHAAAWIDALADFGVARRLEDVRPLIGMGGDKLLPALTGIDAKSDRGRQITARRGARFRDVYLDKLTAFPGTRALFEALARDGVRLAIASSAQKQELEQLLRIAGVIDLVECRTSGDDVDASKPDPDVVHASLERLGVAPAVAVMVGDTPYDVEAARHAAVGAIAFRCGRGWSDRDFAGARAIYDGPQAMLRAYAAHGWCWPPDPAPDR